jgi:hypothetical protein
MLQNVYLKSNEISFEVKRLQNIPALEIREKNGKAKSKGHIFGDYNSNDNFGKDERLPHDPTSSDSNPNVYHGSSSSIVYNRKGRGEGEKSGMRYPNYLSGSDYSIKVLSRQQQHLLSLKYLLHILTVVLVSYTLT